MFASCATPDPTPAAVVPFASVCDEANKDRRVGVRGYLRLPESNTGDFNIVLRLFETSDLGGQPIGVLVRIGAEPNMAEPLPTSYSDDDLNVRLADGTVTHYGTPVTASGDVYYPMGVDPDFECGLDNVYLAEG